MKINHSPIGVIIAGAWGAALSYLLLEKNWYVKLWAYEDLIAVDCKTLVVASQVQKNQEFDTGI